MKSSIIICDTTIKFKGMILCVVTLLLVCFLPKAFYADVNREYQVRLLGI